MQLLSNYTNTPGHCRLCQSAVTPVIDTQRDYDSDGYGGVLYICANCGANIAGLLSWVHPSAKDEFEQVIADQARLIDELEVGSADLAAELATLKEAFTLLSPSEPVKRGPGRPRKATS